ncbi:MAG: LysM peptidoglycan-binding domain-containing protein [Anaerolineae bacterium]|nr:LysM peptidoglycan-binding domain-containing protein [Anaerolineae bacterium]
MTLPIGQISLAQGQSTEVAFDCTDPLHQYEIPGELRFLAVGASTLSGPEWSSGVSNTFCLDTGARSLSCGTDEIPSLLVVQRQAGQTEGAIVVNGAAIRFTSTIGLMIDSNQMYLLVLNGTAQADDLSVPTGYVVQRALNQDQCSPLGPWMGSRPFPAELVRLIEEAEAFIGTYPGISPLPESSPAPMSMPTPTVAPTFTPAPTTCFKRTDWPIYYVKAGDTLYNIALQTSSTVDMLKTANCLTSDIIRIGQPLYVPYLPQPTPTPMPTLTPIPTDDPVTDPVCGPPGTRYQHGRCVTATPAF